MISLCSGLAQKLLARPVVQKGGAVGEDWREDLKSISNEDFARLLAQKKRLNAKNYWRGLRNNGQTSGYGLGKIEKKVVVLRPGTHITTLSACRQPDHPWPFDHARPGHHHVIATPETGYWRRAMAMILLR